MLICRAKDADWQRQWLARELQRPLSPLGLLNFRHSGDNGRLIGVNRLIFTGQLTEHFGLWALLHVISQAINQTAYRKGRALCVWTVGNNWRLSPPPISVSLFLEDGFAVCLLFVRRTPVVTHQYLHNVCVCFHSFSKVTSAWQQLEQL